MKKIVTFGEIMLRLQTPGYKRFKQAQELEMTFGWLWHGCKIRDENPEERDWRCVCGGAEKV